MEWRESIERWAISAAGAIMLVTLPTRGAELVSDEALGLRYVRGFNVSLYADAPLANDITSMTIDSVGRVVVSGPGYIRTLLDENGDGVVDGVRQFASPRSGAMGMCFDGPDLWAMADGALTRYRDADYDGQADGPGQALLPFNFAEHGGHAIRKGPDGWWYIISGNDGHLSERHVALPDSPVKSVEGGALLRVSPDGWQSEVIAHGFRNPYDFDFNAWGDIFTYDSDCERDFLLPWYLPTRLYHVQTGGGHHGWRLEGYLRSFPRPDYYADSVPMLAAMGRGSPTGVACYRHWQFPNYFRGGLFAADWTFGKVYFLPLRPAGESYVTAPEVFLEPIGAHGFAPTDLAVGADGSLFVSIGGRRTRGAVYRIQYTAQPNLVWQETNGFGFPRTELERVLRAPQPLEAWSRAGWVPVAQRLGAAPFEDVVANNTWSESARVRAVEIVTELFDGLTDGVAASAVLAPAAFVRERVAWSLGRLPCKNVAPLLLGLAREAEAGVRNQALQAIHQQWTQLDLATIQQAIAVNLAHPGVRVRQAAAHLAAELPETAWKAFWATTAHATPEARLTATLALLWRTAPKQVNVPAVETCLAVLAQAGPWSTKAEAVRLIILALGDYHLQNPSLELYSTYESALPLDDLAPLMARVSKATAALLPSGVPTLDQEAGRLLAMLEAAEPELPRRFLSLIQTQTSPTADFHYLTVLSRLRSRSLTNVTALIADNLLSLSRKLEGLEQRTKQTWTARVTELTESLLRQDPALADALVRHPRFVSAGNVGLVPLLGSDRFVACARRYLPAAREKSFPWSGVLIDVLSALPASEVHPLFRAQWSNMALRDRLLLELAATPELLDRDKFLAGLTSMQPEVVRASLSALLRLPPDRSVEALVPAARLLRRLLTEPRDQALRAQALGVLGHLAGQPYRVTEPAGPAADLARLYQPVFDSLLRQFPLLAAPLSGPDGEDPARWSGLVRSAVWSRGDVARGANLFVQRGCQTCHAGPTALGPDLSGVTGRMAPTELFDAILFPSRDIAPPYRTTEFNLRNGQVAVGLVVFESADGVLLQTGATTVLRLAEAEIASRRPSALSLMPSGLLAGLGAAELEDLYVYLKTLNSGAR